VRRQSVVRALVHHLGVLLSLSRSHPSLRSLEPSFLRCTTSVELRACACFHPICGDPADESRADGGHHCPDAHSRRVCRLVSRLSRCGGQPCGTCSRVSCVSLTAGFARRWSCHRQDSRVPHGHVESPVADPAVGCVTSGDAHDLFIYLFEPWGKTLAPTPHRCDLPLRPQLHAHCAAAVAHCFNCSIQRPCGSSPGRGTA
jgi:hypothetical protein